MGMVDILFNDAESSEQTDNYNPFDRKPNAKSVENWSSSFRENVKDYDILYKIYVYSPAPGARVDDPGGQNFCCN